MSLGVAGLGCEDALLHLLNYVFPNIFENSPHIIQARRWCRACAAGQPAVHAARLLALQPRPNHLPITPACRRQLRARSMVAALRWGRPWS